MPSPSLIGTDLRLNSNTAGNQNGVNVVVRSDGSALFYWTTSGTGVTAQVNARIYTASGAYVGNQLTGGDIIIAVTPSPTLSAFDLPNGEVGFIEQVDNAIYIARFNANGVFQNGSNEAFGAIAITGMPIAESTPSGAIGVFAPTNKPGVSIGAVLDRTLNEILDYDDLVLNNGGGQSTRDSDGQAWRVIEGAGLGNGNLAAFTTRGSGASAIVQVHILSAGSYTEASPPKTIVSGAAFDLSSFSVIETPQGNFIASWREGNTAIAQRFDQSGNPIGAQMSQAGLGVGTVSVVALRDGGAILLYDDLIQGSREIIGRAFAADGSATSDAFYVNIVKGGEQTNPHGAELANGDIVVAWDYSLNGNADIGARFLSFTRPDAVDDRATTSAGTTVRITPLTNDMDPNGDAIRVTSVSVPTNGTATLDGSTIVYTPKTGFSGTETFNYTITDATGKTDTASVIVTVTAAVANTAPVIGGPRTISIIENVPTSFLVLTAFAVDTEGQKITYSLTGTDASAFALDPGTGAITFRVSPDYEAKASYAFTIVATDDGTPPLSASQAITVNITNVNELPKFTIPATPLTVSIAENSDPSTVVVRLTATDPDGEVVTYGLDGLDAAAFTIDANGALRLSASADYETKSVYFVTVSAKDPTGLSDSRAITVAVTDVNESVAPTLPLLSTLPGNAGTGVSPLADIRLIFNAPVTLGTGTITLARSDGTVVETFGSGSARVSVNGNVLAVDPTAQLVGGVRYSLSIDGNALSVGEKAYAGLTGYDFTTRAVSTASLFQLLVADNGTATVSGSGTVFGTRGVLQDVTVLDAPGRVTFDPSFNAGGDRVRLAGNAADYSVVRSGSTAVLSDGDSEIALPVGAGGLDVHFADGVRTLVFDATAGVVRLGTQTIGATAAVVTAPAASASVTGTATAAPATLIVSEGGSATVHGAATVFGLRTGSEAVSVAKGAVVTFDPSFNAGGDVITLSGDAATYQAMRSSSTFVLTSGSERVTIPIGTAGTAIRFDDAERVLKFDTAANAMKLGDQVIGTTAAGVTAAGAQTAVALTATQSALGGDFRFTHAGAATPDATVTGFARGDSLALSGEAARYVFGGGGGNVTISYLRSDGTLATTTLVGVADPSVYVFDRASAEAAVGFGFISS